MKGWGITSSGCGIYFLSDENVLKLIVVIVVQFCELTKNG
jgi:hypothetical protein